MDFSLPGTDHTDGTDHGGLYACLCCGYVASCNGKKKHEEMQSSARSSSKEAKARNVNENTAEEIFELMARFADYGFNRSCCSLFDRSFSNSYLKAHYPAEFMAAVLTIIKTIYQTWVLSAGCKAHGNQVLPPDVNESELNFSVKEGKIRFSGLSALKGVGGTVEDILTERKPMDPSDIFWYHYATQSSCNE